MFRFIAPLVVFTVIVGFFIVGLQRDPQLLPSALLDKPAPGFSLPKLHEPNETFSPEQMKGKVWLMNVWASWCPSCRDEHPTFLNVSRQGLVDIVGLNYKDKPNDARNWLVQFGGDPYTAIASDIRGDVGIDYGVYGAPETFLIDKQGIVRYRHVGPVTFQAWQQDLYPRIQELNK